MSLRHSARVCVCVCVCVRVCVCVVPRYLVAGASQENDNVWEREGNLDTALDLIERDLVAIYPALSGRLGQWSPVAARAGVKGVAARSALGAIPLCGRLALPDTSPALGQLEPSPQQTVTLSQTPIASPLAAGDLADKVWVFGGLGSRGLIHHSILGRALAQAILTGDPDCIPAPARTPLSQLRQRD